MSDEPDQPGGIISLHLIGEPDEPHNQFIFVAYRKDDGNIGMEMLDNPFAGEPSPVDEELALEQEKAKRQAIDELVGPFERLRQSLKDIARDLESDMSEADRQKVEAKSAMLNKFGETEH